MRDARSIFAAIALLVVLIAPERADAQGIAFQPGVATIPDGVSLSVTPAVSADRRYVRLSLGVQFQTVDSFQNFSFGAAAVGGGGAGGRGGAGGLGGLGGAGGGRGNGGFPSLMAGGYDIDYGIPYSPEYLKSSAAARALKPLKARTSRSKKAWADPIVVPIKKDETKAAAPRG